jgi:integrase
LKLTQTALSKITIPAGKTEHIEFDEELHGFGLRLRSTGARTWIVQYKIGAQNRRLTLGSTAMLSADQARNGWKDQEGRWHDGAAIILASAKQGTDARHNRAKARGDASKTVGRIVANYLAAKKDKFRPRSYWISEYYLNTLWKPLHTFAAGALTREAVASQLSAIAASNGPAAANRARSTLSAMFRWAIGEGLCDKNPVFGTNKREENGPRERILIKANENKEIDWSELVAVWRAAPDSHYGHIVKLLVLTGCRRDEMGNLQWPEVDLEARTIILPKDRTKNGQAHIVPLSEAAIAILKDIPRREGRDYVFGLGDGGYSGWSRSKVALDKKAKLKTPWTLHDLRRTVRTGMGMLGVAPHVAEAVLNHLPAKLIRTYDRNDYTAEKRAALDLWSSHLSVAIAQATGANVTALRPKRA